MPEGDRQLSLADVQLRFRDEGAGLALLMIHGWALDLDMWEPQARALSDSFRIIRYDRRGFGLSSGCPSLERDVEDALALCAFLELDTVAVLGMSQGARIAARVAAACSPRVSGIVLDGAPGGILVEVAPLASEIPLAHYRALVRDGKLTEFRGEWRRHPLAQLRTSDASIHTLLEDILERYRALDLAEVDAPVSPSPLAATSIRCPAMIITGAHDLRSRSEAADALHRCLAGSERVIIQAAGHLSNLDNPRAYNEALRSFLGRFA